MSIRFVTMSGRSSSRFTATMLFSRQFSRVLGMCMNLTRKWMTLQFTINMFTNAFRGSSGPPWSSIRKT